MVKRFIKMLSTSLVGMSLMLGVAAADSSCTITNTGQGSVNKCVTTNTDEETFFCTNDVNVNNTNFQTAQSGTVKVDKNTFAGGATSGDAYNNAVNQVAIDLGCAKLASATTPAATTPAAGGQGAGAAAAAPAAVSAAPKVAALPETGSNAVLDGSAIAVAALGGAAVASKLGLAAYRRVSLK